MSLESSASNGNGVVVQEEPETSNANGLHLPNDVNNNNGGVVQQEGESSNVNVPVPLNDNDVNVPVPLNDNDKKECPGVLPPLGGSNPNKKTLVLDLDGTLVHTTRASLPVGYHFSITPEGCDRPSYYVLKRPGVDQLLQHLGATGLYEIVVFTAASKKYADLVAEKLLDTLPATDSIHIDTKLNIIPPTHRLSSKHCRQVDGVLDEVKDLSVLGRDLKNVIFLDDRPSSYHLQLQNAIPVNKWEGEDFKDTTLFKILSFCQQIANSTTDVRELIFNFLHSDTYNVPAPLNDNEVNVPVLLKDNDKKEWRCVLPAMEGRNPNKKTLVLDLNGTLIHTSRTPMPAGFDFSITFEGRDRPSYYVLKRPGVNQLLQHLGGTGLYEIVLFTAASKEYVDAVVERLLDTLPATDNIHIDTELNIIPPTHRLWGEHCAIVDEVPDEVKDLSVLGRDLKNVIILDDRSSSYHLQPLNAIPVKTWEGEDFTDITLFKILSFCLQIASSATDVRELIFNFLHSETEV